MITFTRTVPVTRKVDVCVIGGGPAGIAAAITASRLSATVYLAEKSQCFGGMATIASVPAFMRFSDGINFVAGGIGREVFERLYEDNTDDTTIEFPIDAEKLKLLYDDMIRTSGIDFTFETSLVGLEMKEETIQHAVFKGKEEFFAVEAAMYIDATGDGTVAYYAGAPFEKGDAEGKMMPATLCTVWKNIDWGSAQVELGKDPDNRMLDKAFEDEVFTVKDPGLPGMWQFPEGMGGGNIGHVFGIDGTKEESITKGMMEARQRMNEYETYYTSYLEGYENARICSTAGVLGIRETRRILGDYVLTMDDYLAQASFPDEIGRYCYPVDVHSSTPEEESRHAQLYEQGCEKGKSYGIPYRSLLPKNVSNLLLSGRCISTDRDTNGSVRVMPGCFITGMAAGAAAALCAGDSRTIDISTLQKELRRLGAYLPEDTID